MRRASSACLSSPAASLTDIALPALWCPGPALWRLHSETLNVHSVFPDHATHDRSKKKKSPRNVQSDADKRYPVWNLTFPQTGLQHSSPSSSATPLGHGRRSASVLFSLLRISKRAFWIWIRDETVDILHIFSFLGWDWTILHIFDSGEREVRNTKIIRPQGQAVVQRFGCVFGMEFCSLCYVFCLGDDQLDCLSRA